LKNPQLLQSRNRSKAIPLRGSSVASFALRQNLAPEQLPLNGVAKPNCHGCVPLCGATPDTVGVPKLP